MALSVTDRGHVTNTAGSAGDAVTTITSGSFTPAAGALLVAIVGAYEFGTLTLSASSTIATGGWTQVSGSASAMGYGIRSSIFYAVCTSTPGTGTVTVTRMSGATTDNWLDLTVIEFGGHAGVRQTAQGNNAAASLTVNLPGARAGGSALVSGAVTALDTTITTPTGWTLLDHTVNAPNNNFAAASARHPSPSADSVTWAGLGTTANTAALIEVAAAPDPAAGQFTVYDHTHLTVTGDAPAVGGASGTFTAYDHTDLAVVGGRASQGQFVNEYLVDGNGDPIVDGNGDPIVVHSGAVTDHTTVAWVGSAPAPVSPEVASATGVAHNAGTDVDTFTDVDPAFAQVTTAAHPPVLLIDPSAAVASSSAAAHGASVDAAAAAGVGAAGVSAYPTQSTVKPSAGVSSVGVAAGDASVSTDSSVGVPADVASVSVAASDVEIHLAVNALIAQTQGSAVNPGVDSPDMGRKRRSGLGGAVLVGAEIGEPLRPPVGR